MFLVLKIDKKAFEIMMEKTPRIRNPKRRREQYETPPSIAAHILWNAFMRGDIGGRDVADLGCGSLRLSIGAHILGAKRIVAVDIDDEVLVQDEEFLEENRYERIILIESDISDLAMGKTDTVVMNPPFGVVKNNRGIDLVFLRKALEIADNIYTIHKYSKGLDKLVREIAESFNAIIVWREIIDFPIPMTFITHRRKIYRIKTVFYIIKRKI